MLTPNQHFAILNKKTAAKRESTGFNLDSLGSPDEISALAGKYEQVQFKNGSQSVLLQGNITSAVAPPVETQSVLAADGTLKPVPVVGPLAQAVAKAQAANAAGPSTKLLLYGGLAIGGVVVIGMLLRR